MLVRAVHQSVEFRERFREQLRLAGDDCVKHFVQRPTRRSRRLVCCLAPAGVTVHRLSQSGRLRAGYQAGTSSPDHESHIAAKTVVFEAARRPINGVDEVNTGIAADKLEREIW